MNVSDRVFLSLQELGYPVSGRSSIVATYGHQELDVVLGEEFQVKVLFEVFVGRLETAHLKVTATSVEVSVRLEKVDVLDTWSL